MSNSGYCGISAIFKINVLKDGTFQSGKITPVSLAKKGIPVFDNENKAIKCLQELLQQDFPENNLEISDNGWITKSENKQPIVLSDLLNIKGSSKILSNETPVVNKIPEKVNVPTYNPSLLNNINESNSVEHSYKVVAGSFKIFENATNLKNHFLALGFTQVKIQNVKLSNVMYRVIIAEFKNIQDANNFIKVNYKSFNEIPFIFLN